MIQLEGIPDIALRKQAIFYLAIEGYNCHRVQRLTNNNSCFDILLGLPQHVQPLSQRYSSPEQRVYNVYSRLDNNMQRERVMRSMLRHMVRVFSL